MLQKLKLCHEQKVYKLKNNIISFYETWHCSWRECMIEKGECENKRTREKVTKRTREQRERKEK